MKNHILSVVLVYILSYVRVISTKEFGDMTDTSKFTPEITELFRPRPPLEYIEHVDIPPNQRKTADITPIGPHLSKLEAYKNEQFPVSEPTEEERIQMEKLAKDQRERQTKLDKFNQDLEDWNPMQDPLIKGSPNSTVFIGRLSYGIDEVQLQQKFSPFGSIERIRIVRDKNTNKSKGYAFVVFERESSAREATREMNGVEIDGRRIITDYERGRLLRSWKPRRLGGGIGGRIDLVKKKQRESQLLVIQEAKGAVRGARGGRGGGARGGARGGPRGGRGGRGGGLNGSRDFGNRDFGSNRYEGRGGYRGGFDDRGTHRSEGGYRGGERDSYASRSRPERESRDPREDRDRAFEYSSRSKREISERERIQKERDSERERRGHKDRDDIGY